MKEPTIVRSLLPSTVSPLPSQATLYVHFQLASYNLYHISLYSSKPFYFYDFMLIFNKNQTASLNFNQLNLQRLDRAITLKYFF